MGASLFRDLMPDELKNILWTLRDSITSVQVQSDEPWIPWELCKLVSSSAGGGVEEGPFSARPSSSRVTRALPVSAFEHEKPGAVVPDDSGLAFAGAEPDYMLSLAGAGGQVTRIPASFLDVAAALASGSYDSWHFSGHALSERALPDRSAPDPARRRTAHAGRPERTGGQPGQAPPPGFSNACQVGQSGMSLTGMGGWAIRFLNAGAGGFLGPTGRSTTSRP